MTSNILQPGTVVAGQYRIDRLIGSGGFARIYRAEEVGLGRPVALKVLSTTVDGKLEVGDPVRERFMREAQLISRLQDPRTITIYGYDSTDDGLLYMALEYVDGVDLRILLDSEGRLTPERIEGLAVQVLKGLREAHQLDCLHRDIKPSNIMVYNRFGEPDCVKLLDFGIAKAVLAEHQMGEDLTREGGVIGTPGYMSPEQLMGRPLTPASDLFSLGVVIYEMYAGRSPYPSRDATEIYRRMQSLAGELGELESAPEKLRETCRKMLQFDVEDRPESAEEVLRMLGAATGTMKRLQARDGAEIDRAVTITDDQLEPVLHTRAITSFPLGLDPAGRTPSTELSALEEDLPDEIDLAATIQRPTPLPTPNRDIEASGPDLATLSHSHELFFPTRRVWPIVLIAASVLASVTAVGYYLSIDDEPISPDLPGASLVVTPPEEEGEPDPAEGEAPTTVLDEEDARQGSDPALTAAGVIARERVGTATFLGVREAQREAALIAERSKKSQERERRRKKGSDRKKKREEKVEKPFEIEAFE